jgi:valyl-tRNA synthetase
VGSNSEPWKVLEKLTVKAARTKTIELLQQAGVLVLQRNITHAVKCAERSGAPLEILPSQQWFIKVLEHKEALKKRSQECNWNPVWMQKRMEQWIDGLNWDWCISRQRIYGVPFPVWYFSKLQKIETLEGTKTYTYENDISNLDVFLADTTDLPINPLTQTIPNGFEKVANHDMVSMKIKCDTIGKPNIIAKALKDFPKYNIKEGETILFVPDTDVMDTWATSSLTPQISSGSAINPNAKLFPADLRPQAHEIIRTWAFYTLTKAHLHNDNIPWRNLMISGWCLASDKTKMSKSKGNVITPLSLLQEKSADAVRHWASTAKLGTDTAFSEDLLKIGAKLTNKLWNAAKFASAQLEAIQGESASATAAIQAGIITCEIDKWLIARTQATIAACDTCFADYDYSGARIAVEDLFWNDFCDNYLEIVKARAYGQQGEGAQQSALHTIYHVFNAILKLFAPFIPHITEELFAKLYQGEFEKCDSIHARGNFPNVANFESGIKSTNDWDITKAIVELIRKAKSERGVSIKYPLEVAAITGISDELFAAISDDIKAVGNITTLHNQLLTQAHAVLQDSELQLSVVFADEAEVA